MKKIFLYIIALLCLTAQAASAASDGAESELPPEFVDETKVFQDDEGYYAIYSSDKLLEKDTFSESFDNGTYTVYATYSNYNGKKVVITQGTYTWEEGGMFGRDVFTGSSSYSFIDGDDYIRVEIEFEAIENLTGDMDFTMELRVGTAEGGSILENTVITMSGQMSSDGEISSITIDYTTADGESVSTTVENNGPFFIRKVGKAVFDAVIAAGGSKKEAKAAKKAAMTELKNLKRAARQAKRAQRRAARSGGLFDDSNPLEDGEENSDFADQLILSHQ